MSPEVTHIIVIRSSFNIVNRITAGLGFLDRRLLSVLALLTSTAVNQFTPEVRTIGYGFFLLKPALNDGATSKLVNSGANRFSDRTHRFQHSTDQAFS
ncbi:hypothetical protein PGTUg99_033252 [Puccinia graminis f. sp. tritici]|uniref:Uncharacterized protein n=1 Tax=Puccinia graminis f. sp. tritici TaxID=56615 RepID=A0A5B0RMW8_PUCGR|nr:hypothetical protein PGTUg99_033252 [Puccinia graminis f. sp. tritici]